MSKKYTIIISNESERDYVLRYNNNVAILFLDRPLMIYDGSDLYWVIPKSRMVTYCHMSMDYGTKKTTRLTAAPCDTLNRILDSLLNSSG
jgi:hypothetical protein